MTTETPPPLAPHEWAAAVEAARRRVSTLRDERDLAAALSPERLAELDGQIAAAEATVADLGRRQGEAAAATRAAEAAAARDLASWRGSAVNSARERMTAAGRAYVAALSAATPAVKAAYAELEKATQALNQANRANGRPTQFTAATNAERYLEVFKHDCGILRGPKPGHHDPFSVPWWPK